MMSMETSPKKQSQQSLMYDERVGQSFEFVDSSVNDSINPMKSMIDRFFSEQVRQQGEQRHSSRNDMRTNFDRSRSWNNVNSTSLFCATMTDTSPTLHGSTCSLRSTYDPYRASFAIRSDLTASSLNLSSARILSSSINTNIDQQTYFAIRLSSTALTGSHDRIADTINTIDSIVPQILTGVMGQSSSTPNLFPHNTTTTFSCTLTSDSSAFENLPSQGSNPATPSH